MCFTEFAKWLNEVADSMSSGKFRSIVEGFMADIADLGAYVHAALHPVSTIAQKLSDRQIKNTTDLQGMFGWTDIVVEEIDIRGVQVRLGIVAPREVSAHRR